MMQKVFAVAAREFTSTVMTKAFVIGAFVIPGVFVAVIPLIVKMTAQAKSPPLVGTVAVIDRSGAAADAIREELSPAGLARRIAEGNEELQRIVQQFGGDFGPALDNPAVQAAMAQAFGEAPELTVEVLPPGTAPEEVQPRLKPANAGQEGSLVALAVIAPDAVERPPGAGAFGGFELFVRAKTDDRNIDHIRTGVRRAILAERYRIAGVNAAELGALTNVAVDRKEITDSGEARASTAELNMMLPFGFMLLLMMSVMVGGQYLLTTTIEEKSSRVVEVLLSAVSPMQLMTGKIIGQMGVGMVLLGVYASVGIAALSTFAVLDLITLDKIAYLVIYFVLAYFIIASLMAAIGASVNELREAQSLMGPVMLVIMLPYLFWLPITRDPNSTLALVLSMVPPMSPFAMIVRITSTEPPPVWQVWLSIAITAVAAYGCVWFAAKVFRVGLLMYGKPPNFKTLIRWVRMA
ncbi:MAG TPA: ABC transporter permease [Phycisphaerales bacterium]|nr:ABC transporter permease [Phycisphaerales bacterium]